MLYSIVIDFVLEIYVYIFIVHVITCVSGAPNSAKFRGGGLQMGSQDLTRGGGGGFNNFSNFPL